MTEGVTVFAEVGHQEDLSAATALRIGGFLRHSMAKAPYAQFGLMMSGYDKDTRNLWEIPEVCTYMIALLRAAGIMDWRSDLVPRFDESTIAMLALCGALGADHPFKVNVMPGPANAH